MGFDMFRSSRCILMSIGMLSAMMCQTSAQDFHLLCEEKWAIAVFPTVGAQQWRNEKLVPTGRYVVTREQSEFFLRELDTPDNELFKQSCFAHLDRSLTCGSFEYRSANSFFTYVHFNGTFILYSGGTCRA
jgi:hypothetical protein